MRRALPVALIFLVAPTLVRACDACFSAEDSPMIDGAKMGVWLLAGLTLCVQGAFVAFFIYLRKRARMASATELELEWSGLQRETRHS